MKNEISSIYYHCIIEEYDKLNNKHIKLEDIYYLCSSIPNVRYYSFILHDKDDTRLHYHINLVFSNNGYIKDKVLFTIARILEINVNCISVKSTSSSGMYDYFRYLIHLDSPNKYQYDIQNVFCNDMSILNDCLSGVNPFDLGIDYLINLVKSSSSKANLYAKLGIKFSNHYYKIINDLWDMKNLL